MKLELPQIGLGTCFGSPEEMKQATTGAIDVGYKRVFEIFGDGNII